MPFPKGNWIVSGLMTLFTCIFEFKSVWLQSPWALLCSCCCSCSVTQLCSTLCDPRDCSMPGFSVPHRLLRLGQVHVYYNSDAVQLAHSLQLEGAKCSKTISAFILGDRSKGWVRRMLLLLLSRFSRVRLCATP